MSYRIIDRLVIWTGTAASVFVLCGGHPGAADIAVILVSFILGIAGGLKRNELIAILSAVAVFAASFLMPGMALVMPTAVYSLVICSRKIEKNMSSFGRQFPESQLNHFYELLFIGISLIPFLCRLVKNIGLHA